VMGRYKRELSVLVAYGLLLAALAAAPFVPRGDAAAAAPSFYQADNLRAILVSNAPLLVAAVGMTLVILARQIDISIGSQFCICGVVAGLLARAGVPMPAVVVATLLAGAALGALNGALVAGLGLPSIVVTLATLVILRESLR